jgi:uracil-DNA glycosylase
VSSEESQLSAAQRREALKEVFAQAQGCLRCSELAATRRTVVFGAGDADADLMFVGEAPGASEDEQGLPFVGQAGRLLEQLLGEIDLKRKDVFIANVLKCRPPGNRDPQPVEIENCGSTCTARLS